MALIARHAPPQHGPDGNDYGTTAPEGETALDSPPTQHLQLENVCLSSMCHGRAAFEPKPEPWPAMFRPAAAAVKASAYVATTLQQQAINVVSIWKAGPMLTQRWHAIGIIEASFQSSHDWRGRPRMVTGSSGAVSADHGRCSDMGAPLHWPCIFSSIARCARSSVAALRCYPPCSKVHFMSRGRPLKADASILDCTLDWLADI